MRRSRRGFTLIELLITAIVMAILGSLLVRMLVSDARFVERVGAQMSARQTARAALTVMSTDLRMASARNVVAATATQIRYISPIAWGMACQRSGGNVIGTLIPTDSIMLASALAGGVAWLDSAGNFNNILAGTTIISGPRAECTADSIRVLPGGQYVQINPVVALPAGDIPSGTIFFTWDVIRYEFRASVASPGRIGLWRDAETAGVTEEILSPFDVGSRFEFVTEPNGNPSVTPPFLLSTLFAIELVIIGESLETPRDATDPEEFELRTRVTFVN